VAIVDTILNLFKELDKSKIVSNWHLNEMTETELQRCNKTITYTVDDDVFFWVLIRK